jgi:hypothetical protein
LVVLKGLTEAVLKAALKVETRVEMKVLPMVV